MHEPLLLKTQERDSRKLPVPVRGAKYWAAVEVPGEVWWMVEGSQLHSADSADIKRVITTSLDDALERVRTGRLASASLFAYVREPTTFVNGHLFQRVEEVHRFNPAGELLVRFCTGVMVTIQDGEIGNSQPVGVGHRIYPWLPPPR